MGQKYITVLNSDQYEISHMTVTPNHFDSKNGLLANYYNHFEYLFFEVDRPQTFKFTPTYP